MPTSSSKYPDPPKPHSTQRNVGTYYVSALDAERQRLAPLGISIGEGANPVRVIGTLADEVVRLRQRCATLERDVAGRGGPAVDALVPALRTQDDPWWFAG